MTSESGLASASDGLMDGAHASWSHTGAVHLLQSAPEEEATFYSMPFIEALRACVRRWNTTAGGKRVHRLGSTAGGLAGQGTGVHTLTQDRLLVERHYEACYAAQHMPVSDDATMTPGALPWQCPVHTADAAVMARSHAAEGETMPVPPHGASNSRRGSRRSSAVETTSPAARPAAAASISASPPTTAPPPDELDLTSPMGVAWMLRTAAATATGSGGDGGADELSHSGTKAGQNDGGVARRKKQDVASDAEAAEALRSLHAGLRRALGFPAKDDALLAVDDLLLDLRSETLAVYPLPQRTAHHPHPNIVGRHADAECRTPHDDVGSETVMCRGVPDQAWRSAPLPTPPTLSERTAHLVVHRRELAGRPLCESGVLEWFIDTLQFADRMSFSTTQTRCVLLDAVGLIETMYAAFDDLEATPATCSAALLNEEDHVVEEAITACLQDALSAQACPVTMRVVERQLVEKPVSREVPDPDVVGPLERRLASEKLNKKQQQQLRDQIAAAPLITQTEIQNTVEEAEKDITVGPYFNLHETAAILEHLTTSLVTHWRLWRLTLCRSQPETVQTYDMAYDDTAPFCVPPLSQFCPDTLYDRVLEQHALYVEACRALEMTFELVFAEPLRALEEAKQHALSVMRAEQKRDTEANQANVLSAEEFDRVERAFLVRLNQKLSHHSGLAARLAATVADSTTLESSTAGAEDCVSGFAATAPPGVGARQSLSPAPPSAADLKKGGKGSSGKRGASTGRSSSASRRKTQNALGATLEASRVAAESVVLPADTVFAIDEVEKRVDAAEQEWKTKLEASNAPKKKGR